MSVPRKGRKVVFSIDPMTEPDLPQVLAIERASFSSPWTRQSFLFDIHDNPFARSIVARDTAGQVLGYGCAWVVHEELRINNIAVRADSRGSSIGRALLRHLLDAGRSEKCRTALLEVRPSNLVAIALYESEGFVQVGRRKNYYTVEREDALVMAYDLIPDED